MLDCMINWVKRELGLTGSLIFFCSKKYSALALTTGLTINHCCLITSLSPLNQHHMAMLHSNAHTSWVTVCEGQDCSCSDPRSDWTWFCLYRNARNQKEGKCVSVSAGTTWLDFLYSFSFAFGAIRIWYFERVLWWFLIHVEQQHMQIHTGWKHTVCTLTGGDVYNVTGATAGP